MEAFSIEIIHALNEPTIGRFAEFLNISQSNATYKVNSLIKKGYLKKQNSDTDRREYHLILSEKYYSYTDIMRSYVKTVLGRIEDSFTPEETELFSNMLMRISAEMMPEAGGFEYNRMLKGSDSSSRFLVHSGANSRRKTTAYC